MNQDRTRRLTLALFLLILVLAPIFSTGVNLVVDWIWFRQEGFRVIFANILKAQIALSGLAGMGFIIFAGINLFIARAVAQRQAFRVNGEILEFPVLDRLSTTFRWLIWAGVLLVGSLMSHWGMQQWNKYLLAKETPILGQADPLFGIDLGFYLFRLPFQWFLYHFALVTLILTAIAVLFMYFLEGGVSISPRGASLRRGARAHLMILGSILFLVLAYQIRLAMYDLLFSTRGVVYGATYTDVKATLPVLKFLLVLSLLTALVFLWAAVRGRLRPAIYGILAMAAVWLIGVGFYPELMQRFIVAPNEIEKERPYIARAIEATRKAYALDRFEEREFSAIADLKLEDIQKNEPTIRNIRLWDHKPLLTTFAQLQEIRTYYDFQQVDNDRYWINNAYRQVSLSPRELSAGSLPSRNWINEHLVYTHGYGLCLGPVNESTREGLPEFFIKDIPPASNDSIRIKRPEVYFGELANEYCVVKTAAQEFDYPAGDQNVYTTYQGGGGIPVEGLWRRLLFALRFGEIKIVLSSDIQAESRVMIYRNILDRAHRLTPFLRYDHDPYMVIAQDGTLYWILDGYTTSAYFPYSEPTPDIGNYLRNSVKATINAYDGQVRFYIADPEDPLIQAYARMFPGVFQPMSAMPADLRAHIRYPEEFFATQANKYAVFHMTDPRVFYNKEDMWRVAQSALAGTPRPVTPYFTIMKLAEVGEKEEFILMVPFSPARKDNMIAWMAARCDEPNYGKVLVFAFPKQKLVFGPQQIESRIDQEPTISQQLSLWGQGGSKVIRGTLLVIPVLNSVLYVQPLYLAAEAGGGLPQLTRVIVSYAEHVVMEPTLEAALGRIFGGQVSTGQAVAPTAAAATGTAPTTVALAPNVTNLVREASQHYERALQLQRQGDWAGYGEEIKKLGETLKRLATAK